MPFNDVSSYNGSHSAAMPSFSRPVPWQVAQAAKRADQVASLDRWHEWRLKEVVPEATKDVSKFTLSRLTVREFEIVHHDATALVEHLRNRVYSAVEVLTAFCKVAMVTHSLTNCLTEIFFEDGLKRAAELDKYITETGEVVGPLHGLPVSVKDHIFVKGLDTSSGYTAWAYKSVATQDAVAVDILRKAGAVLYVKTSNPQTLLVGLQSSSIVSHELTELGMYIVT